MAKNSGLKEFLLELNKDDNKLFVDLASASANKYANLQKIKLELQHIKGMAETLYSIEENKEILSQLPFDEHKRRLIRQALWFAIIIGYSKCFSDTSKDKGKTKLEKKII